MGEAFRFVDSGRSDHSSTQRARLALAAIASSGTQIIDRQLIFAKLIDETTGAGSSVELVSTSKTPGRIARRPAVTYNRVENEFLLAWRGTDTLHGLAQGEVEIFGQRLNENGTAQGVSDFRMSNIGLTYVGFDFSAIDPAIAFNLDADEYLVVWSIEETGLTSSGRRRLDSGL